MKPGKKLNTWCGSPVYAGFLCISRPAPEIVQRQGYEGPKVDVWSLGIILYSLGEDSNIVNMAAFLEGRFRYPVNVPLSPELKHLINMMLIPDYNKRASLNDVIEHQWTNIGYNEAPHDSKEDFTPLGTDPINIELVKQMTFMGFKRQSIVEKLKLDEQSPELATYNRLQRIQHERVTNTPLPRRLSQDIPADFVAMGQRRHSALPRSMNTRRPSANGPRVLPPEWFTSSSSDVPVVALASSKSKDASSEESGEDGLERVLKPPRRREAFSQHLDELGGDLKNVFLCWDELVLYSDMQARGYSTKELEEKMDDIRESFLADDALYPLTSIPSLENISKQFAEGLTVSALKKLLERVLMATEYIQARLPAERHSGDHSDHSTDYSTSASGDRAPVEVSSSKEEEKSEHRPDISNDRLKRKKSSTRRRKDPSDERRISRRKSDKPPVDVMAATGRRQIDSHAPDPMRKHSLASAPVPKAHDQSQGIRMIQGGPFSADTTTRLDPQSVLQKIRFLLGSTDLGREASLDGYTFKLNLREVGFSVEVVLLAGMTGLSGLKFSRTRGDAWAYRDEVQKFIQRLALP